MADLAKEEADIIHETIPTELQMDEMTSEIFDVNYDMPSGRGNGRDGDGSGKKGGKGGSRMLLL